MIETSPNQKSKQNVIPKTKNKTDRCLQSASLYAFILPARTCVNCSTYYCQLCFVSLREGGIMYPSIQLAGIFRLPHRPVERLVGAVYQPLQVLIVL
jgi:hypothetical protein